MESLLFVNQRLNDPKDKLLSAALHRFAEKGFKETSVLEVVERAHVSKTTFYNFFGSKEELLVHLFQHLLEEVLSEVKAAGQQEKSITCKALAGIRCYLKICMNHRSAARLLLVSSVGISPAVEEVRQQAHVRFAKLIYSTVQSELGQLSDGEIRVVSQAMVGAINEVVVQKIIGPDQMTDVEPLAELLNRIVSGAFKFLIWDELKVPSKIE